jgi:hypothetical protein
MLHLCAATPARLMPVHSLPRPRVNQSLWKTGACGLTADAAELELAVVVVERLQVLVHIRRLADQPKIERPQHAKVSETRARLR